MIEDTAPDLAPVRDSAGTALADLIAAIGDRKLPPVELWHPTHCGDSDMRIAADGTWWHAGTPIGRPELVRLFSTILRREADGSYVLVTPGEKLDILVDDAPFVAVEATVAGEGAAATIAFRLNTGDHVVAGAGNRLRVETAPDGTPRPYLHVRAGLEALVARAVFYQLAEIALAADPPGVWSGGEFFVFGSAA
jgi:hypothetical protein